MAKNIAYISKYFKHSSSAKEKTQVTSLSNGRVCELNPRSERLVPTWTAGQRDGFDNKHWSQKGLHEAAQESEC